MNPISRRSPGDLGVSPDRVRNLGEVHINSEAEFFFAVRSFFYEIRHLVEQDEGYRMLVTHNAEGAPTLRSEEEIQIASSTGCVPCANG